MGTTQPVASRSADGRVPTGVPGLDEILGGGLPHHKTALVKGETGAGKTTLAMHFAMAGAQSGEIVLYIGTSETRADLEVLAIGHGWSLDGIAFRHYYDRSDDPAQEPDQTIFHPAEVELPQTMEWILATIDAIQPDRLIIDSLSEIRVLAGEPRWYRQQLIHLERGLAERRCTTVFTDQDCDDLVALHSLVSSVIELSQEAQVYGPARRRMYVRKVRGQDFATGFHDMQLRVGGMTVFPRLVVSDHQQNFEPAVLSSGIKDLDEMLGGGIVRGTTTLIAGQSGVGKSLLATQFAVAAAERGQRTELFILDERLHTLLRRAEGVGLRLKQHVDAGLVVPRQINLAEWTPGQFSHAVQTAVERDGASAVVVDSLNGYHHAMAEERFLNVHLYQLAAYLDQRAVNTYLVATQHGLLGTPTANGLDVSYIADSVLLLRNFEYEGQIRKAVSVYKRRAGGHETTIRELILNHEGIQLSRPLTNFRGILTGEPQVVQPSNGAGYG